MKRWLPRLFIPLIALVGIVFLLGLAVEERHVVTRSAELPAPPAMVWGVVRDFGAAAAWQPGVRSMTRVDGESSETWRMEGDFGEVPIRIEDEVAERELVTRIVDEGLPFGGTWIYQLEPTEAGTRLTLTENGFIRNPFYRFMARYVFGYERTIDEYLDALRARLTTEAV